MIKKTFVIDTNILLTDPNAIFSFKDNEVVLPFVVLEELDQHKNNQGEVGLNAREISRRLHDLLKVAERQTMKKGIALPNGGRLKVVSATPFIGELQEELGVDKADNHILAVCLGLKAKKIKTVLVTNDMLLRVKADAAGIANEDYRKNVVADNVGSLYSGVRELFVEKEELSELWNKQKDREFLTEFMNNKIEQVSPNEFVHVKNGSSNKPFLIRNQNGIAKFVPEDFELPKVKPRNIEQRLALDLLMDNSIKLVTISGLAGSGKTLISLASGLEQVLEKKKYKSLLVCRPVQPVGKDIGFLPGPQPLDAKILTPTGWTTMGEISIGDEVISREGLSAKVLGIFPKGEKTIYRVTTTDGTSTECCEDHLWYTTTALDRIKKRAGSVKTTREIINSLTNPYKPNRANHHIPRNEAVQYKTKNKLPLSPYLLGALLGDGSLSKTSTIEFINNDQDITERVSREVSKYNCCLLHKKNTISYRIKSKSKGGRSSCGVCITNLQTNEKIEYHSINSAVEALNMTKSELYNSCLLGKTCEKYSYELIQKKKYSNPVKQKLFTLGLLGCKSYNKFIPSIYKYSSIKDRLALLRGIMDTDGTISKNGLVGFTTTSKQLALDVIEVVRSLGGRAKLPKVRNRIGHRSIIKNRVITTKKESYEFSINISEYNPFYCKRKFDRFTPKKPQGVGIKSIEVTNQKDAQCILIDNPEHLYITDDFIVTHNTKEEKMEPWLAPVKDNLRFLLSSDNGRKSRSSEATLDYYFDRGIIEVEAMTYIRGRSIANAFILIDEVQNISAHELKTIITRVGEGTKIVLTGDLEQIDNLYVDSVSNGLAVAIERFKKYDIAGHITLLKGERSALATLAAKIL